VESKFNVRIQVKVTLRPTISRPVRLGVRRTSGTPYQFFFVVAVGVLLAADSQSTSSSGYRASLWDP
jgi:hypothetical protein